MSLIVEGCALRGNTVQGCGYNCVEMGGTTHMTLSDSVFLRDTPPDMFVYGTTDIILGGVDGTSSITANDFNRRGEYEGGPDGCAIDFETSSSGVRVDGNTIFKSWGAGIMVFGELSFCMFRACFGEQWLPIALKLHTISAFCRTPDDLPQSLYFKQHLSQSWLHSDTRRSCSYCIHLPKSQQGKWGTEP
jgi:hypothetical protein